MTRNILTLMPCWEDEDSLSLAVAGDIMLSRNVAQKIKEYGDPNSAFAER